MAIKFICSCGKHLKARDEMAARRSFCPRCGEPIGIPSRQPAAPGALLGPMTPQERRRLARQRVPPPDDRSAPGDTPPAAAAGPAVERSDPGLGLRSPQPLEPAAVRQPVSPKRPRPRYEWPLEKHWYQCLAYPFRALPPLLGLASLLTLLSATVVLGLPLLIEAQPPPGWVGWLAIGATGLLAAFTFFGFSCGFLQCVFTSSAAGEAREVLWSGRDMAVVPKATARWLVCFLAGPVVPAVGAYFYWLHGGDLGVLDWLILAEMVIVAVGYWLLAILAASRRDRLLDANPLRVADLVERVGPRVVLAVGLVTLLVLAHGLGIFFALEQMHVNTLGGLVCLFLCWLGMLFGTTFVFRLVGLWCYRTPWWSIEAAKSPAPTPPAPP
jgi:hypothetical protein